MALVVVGDLIVLSQREQILIDHHVRIITVTDILVNNFVSAILFRVKEEHCRAKHEENEYEEQHEG